MATVEAGCQEEAQKKKAEKKRKRRRTIEKDNLGMKLPKKWLRALRRRQGRMKMPSQQYTKQLGKASSRVGIACSSRGGGR